jgi:hypothetical protein
VDGTCVSTGCQPPCDTGQHCVGITCEANVCAPPCGAGETCLTHGGTDCACLDPPCGGPTPCADGLDNDGDGWIDAADPDCAVGDAESGLGVAECNDGTDNDGDGWIDAADPDCLAATDDERLGGVGCVDVCTFEAVQGDQVCQLWDETAQSWVEGLEDGPGHLHHRARAYTAWLRSRLMPLGGVMRGYFADTTFTDLQAYGGTRDSPIWTGTYLAAEALRYQVTGAPDARAQIDETVRVLDRWWRISGDQGYLARYAAPTSSPPEVLAIFDPAEAENHRDVSFEGDTWHWKGNTSRDQYQGVMLGYALAYDATDDEALREIIRARVVELIEQLMVFEERTVKLVVDGFPLTVQMDLGHCVYTNDDTSGGVPVMTITTNPFELLDAGVLTFWPNPAEFLRQVPMLSWLPDVYQNGQAIQLGGMFAAALHVTENVPAYAARRQAIQAHYDAYFAEWLDVSQGWSDTNTCGSSYHGLNIAFEPAWSWVRLEADAARRAQLQTTVLRDRLWDQVSDHKNVFFAFIYTSQASAADDTAAAIDLHRTQLALFPPAPNTGRIVDNTGEYPADPDCEGLSLVAIDVDDRVPSTFMWERNPWKLVETGEPSTLLYSGVDYLVTYWMARAFGYLEEDAPGQCLRWRPL